MYHSIRTYNSLKRLYKTKLNVTPPPPPPPPPSPYVFKHIKAETKCPPFWRRHSLMHFLNKMYECRSRFHWMFVLKVPTNNIPTLVPVMACANQATSHCLNQWWLDYRRIYPSRGLKDWNSRNTQNDSHIPKDFKYCFGWYLKWVSLWMFVRGRWWYMPDCTFMNKHIESESEIYIIVSYLIDIDRFRNQLAIWETLDKSWNFQFCC